MPESSHHLSQWSHSVRQTSDLVSSYLSLLDGNQKNGAPLRALECIETTLAEIDPPR